MSNDVGADGRTFTERLKLAIGTQSLDSFASAMNMPYRTLHGYLRGERQPNADGLAKLARVGINLNWLLTGEGKMLTESGARPAHRQIAAELRNLAARLEE